MAREIANVQTSLWGNPEWKGLGIVEQWLYLHLMSHPTLSYAGVADWLPKRVAAASNGLTVEQVNAAGRGLQAARFVFVDEATDEVLVRSFLRHDGLLKQPRLSVSMVNAFSAVASLKIQKVVIHELQKLAVEFPQWKAFESEKVQVILKYEGADMGTFLPLPETTDRAPFGLNASQSLGLHTTTSTSTATSSREDRSAKRGSRVPEPFVITDEMRKWASEEVPLVDLDKKTVEFVDYWAALPGQRGVKSDWVRTWKNDMRKKQEFAERDGSRKSKAPAEWWLRQ